MRAAEPEVLRISGPCAGLRGHLTVPGDKSISHRALLFNALGVGAARVRGLARSGDVGSTRAALSALGVHIEDDGEHVIVHGTGGRLTEALDVIDCGNSGTTLRLLLGVLASQPFFSVLTGDLSLRGRPQARVVAPLRAMGAIADGRAGGDRAPIGVRGRRPLQNQRFTLPVASAQVATALLLAGLFGEGEQDLLLPGPARDHTERLLAQMGAALQIEPAAEGGRRLRLAGGGELGAVDVQVPGDLSSALFPIVGAILTHGSELRISGVGLNPTRTGALDVLSRMGARLSVEADPGRGEPIGQVSVRAGGLRGTVVEAHEIPRLLDEIPVLAVAAARAHGLTEFRGASELRHKESDRLATTARLVRAFGGQAEERGDALIIEGNRGAPLKAAEVHAHGDHRVAMAAAVAALGAIGESRISGATCISTSFPGFAAALSALGAEVRGEGPGGAP